MLSGAPAGLFVIVGGDRAFRAAALLKDIEQEAILSPNLDFYRLLGIIYEPLNLTEILLYNCSVINK